MDEKALPNKFHVAPETFVQEICQAVREGWGFTPLIGAGASSRSGVLMGLEFTEYLTYTVYRCVVQEDIQGRELGKSIRLWNVSEDGWPDAPRPSEVDKVRCWVFRQYDHLCDQCGLQVNSCGDGEFVESISIKPPGENAAKAKRAHGGTPGKKAKDAGTSGPATMDKQIRRPLLPRILQLPGKTQVDDESVKRFLRNLGAENAARGLLLNPDISPDSEAGLVERAIRSLHDWRSMLLFLAELHAVFDEKGTRRAFLGKSNSNVIDLFGAFITQGRKPNLTHSMLGHLTGPMRMRLVLTTNFDALLEDAFTQLNLSFREIPVGTKASLPDPKTVRAQNTILKLHGSLTDIRADFSLDEAPSTEEKDKFFDYVAGRRPGRSASESSAKTPTTGFLPSHLLVIGFHGDDRRIMHLLKHVLDHSSDIRIFWVCHSKSDSAFLKSVFSEPDYEGRITATETDRSDLFLLELYQELTLSLPEGGFSYQYSHDAPPELWITKAPERARLNPARKDKMPEPEELTGIVKEVMKRSKRLEQLKPRRSGAEIAAENKICTVRIAPSKKGKIDKDATQSRNGLMVRFRQAFDKLLENRFNCVWLEMEDYADAHVLAHTFLQVISLRLGLFQLEHAVLMPTRFKEGLDLQPRDKAEFWRRHIERLTAYFRIQPEKWVLFLYGRNVPGICTGWGRQPWDEKKYADLKLFLYALCANKFIVVYAPYASERYTSDCAKFEKLETLGDTLEKRTVYGKAPEEEASPEENRGAQMHGLDCANVYPEWKDTVNKGFDRIKVDCDPAERGFDALIKLVKEKFDRDFVLASATGPLAWLRLLYACTLFRRSRPITAFLADGVLPPAYPLNSDGIDNDLYRHRKVKEGLEDFNRQFIYRKPGGKIWVFRDTLFTMRALLHGMKYPGLNGMWELCARTHFWIGMWYMRAFCTSNHSVPLLEAFHHFYQSLLMSPLAGLTQKAKGAEITEEDLRVYRRKIFVRSLTEWIKLLQLGRQGLLFWMDKPAAEPMFGDKERNAVIVRLKKGLNEVFKDEVFKDKVLRDAVSKRSCVLSRGHAEDLLLMLKAEMESLWSEFDRQLARPVVATSYRSAPGNLDDRLEIEAGWRKPLVFGPGGNWRKPEQKQQPGKKKQPEVIPEEWLKLLKEDEKPDQTGSKLYDSLGSLVRNAVATMSAGEALPNLVAALYDLAYLHVRRAKIKEQLNASPKKKAPKILQDLFGSTVRSRRLWVQVTVLSRCVLEMCQLLPPHLVEFELGKRAEALTLYGLALGRLGRFTEGHRILNHASSLLSKISRKVDSIELSIVLLRRAELYVQESAMLLRMIKLDDLREYLDKKSTSAANDELIAQWKKIYLSEDGDGDRAGLARVMAAKLDDAWVTLENAERMLAGRNRSSQWWGRLCNLRLRIFAQNSDYKRSRDKMLKAGEGDGLPVFKLLAFRKRMDQHTHLMHLLKLGNAVWPDDPFRRMRLVDYFLDAWEHEDEKAPWLAKNPDAKELLKQSVELGDYYTMDPRKYGLLTEFWKRTQKRVNKATGVETSSGR